ncbi:hypothetical protein DY000_02026825 [Brassica cretica]|uniref:PDZ domain-containing protein n=1 Tax=Brassica cretica TaxID=69181 RepID=A0ABQ7EBP4_BRACR|nr:hypothetical protein DY000_02026825 [Brassica cretica]
MKSSSDLIPTVHVDQRTDVGTPATTKRVEEGDVIEGVSVRLSEDYGYRKPEQSVTVRLVREEPKNNRPQSKIRIN